MTARSPQRQRLHDLLEPVVSATGYELVDVSVTAAGRRSLVRVTVDGDAGIDLDGVADVSRAVSDALDAREDAFAGPFVLEVSSPGVDRPLTEPRLWQRALGRLVSVELGDAPEPITARVLAADDSGLTIDIGGTSSLHSWDTVGTGKVQVEFSRPDQPAGHGGSELDVFDDGLDDQLDELDDEED
jgi:ribosome maturation factor RimP